jgi:glycosyltransferase involved in cell wall biosynthesis
VLPAYNADRFLAAAINSILQQTETNFELILIDDHSSDATTELLATFRDNRIHVIRNEVRLGVAMSLNKGLQLARGTYIARMDADDLSHPDRLRKQALFLDQNPDIAAIDTLQQLINERGELTDQTNYQIHGTANIQNKMPWVNCLGHPSIMIRREVLMHYSYREIVYEDLDLWLRLLNDGHLIDKLTEPLFYYRKHDSSITGIDMRLNRHFQNIAATKWFYWNHLSLKDKGKLFNLFVFAGMVKDQLTGIFKILKQNVNSISVLFFV